MYSHPNSQTQITRTLPAPQVSEDVEHLTQVYKEAIQTPQLLLEN